MSPFAPYLLFSSLHMSVNKKIWMESIRKSYEIRAPSQIYREVKHHHLGNQYQSQKKIQSLDPNPTVSEKYFMSNITLLSFMTYFSLLLLEKLSTGKEKISDELSFIFLV